MKNRILSDRMLENYSFTKEQQEFIKFIKTAPFEELLEQKKHIRGLIRCGHLMRRQDLTDEQKKQLLPKRRIAIYYPEKKNEQ